MTPLKTGPTLTRWNGRFRTAPSIRCAIASSSKRLASLFADSQCRNRIDEYVFAAGCIISRWECTGSRGPSPKFAMAAVEHKDRRASPPRTREDYCARGQFEHSPITNCFASGGSQTDIAHLTAEDIDGRIAPSPTAEENRSVRHSPFGTEAATGCWQSLPQSGQLFPNVVEWREYRAKDVYPRLKTSASPGFRCLLPLRLAERAKGTDIRSASPCRLLVTAASGYRAYAKNAHVKLPSLEDYERKIVRAAAAVG